MPIQHQQASPSLCSTSSSLAAPLTNNMGPNILYTPRASDVQNHVGNNNPQQHFLHASYNDQNVLCYPDITCTSNSSTLQNTLHHHEQQQNNKDNIAYPKTSSSDNNTTVMTENMLFG